MPYPVTPYRRPQDDEGLSPGLIVAMWVGGGVAAVSLLAILLTSLLGGSDETAGEPSVVKRASAETPALAAADQPANDAAETEAAPWPALAEQDTAARDVGANVPVAESDSAVMEPEPINSFDFIREAISAMRQRTLFSRFGP